MRLWWRLWLDLAEPAFGENLESSGRFCVGAFGKNLAFSRHEDVFTFNLLFKKLYTFCILNAIFKDNDAMNCIDVKHKKG
jgi:hypothetical protein